MRTLLLFLVLAGCSAGDQCVGTQLFGQPNQNTGLDETQCAPRCNCAGQEWNAPSYTADDISRLRRMTVENPPSLLTENPYLHPAPEIPASSVCAVFSDGANAYRLQTFESADAAEAAGARVTHLGVCGLCSSLTDLAVYIAQPELTTPVRACGLMYPAGPSDKHIACLAAIGFTEPCAQIWYYNTLHTRDECLSECVEAIGKPFHLPDGTLNPCLLCDEEKSGAVFKAIAGRTRRNTGVPSSMCRPCQEVTPLDHRLY